MPTEDVSGVQRKVWGVTQCLELNDVSSIHRLEVKAGFRCSIHRHHFRHNGFLVLSALIHVRWWDEAGEENVDVLGPGAYRSYPPGIWHRFEVYGSGSVIEYYWGALNTIYDVNDIERRDEGGPL